MRRTLMIVSLCAAAAVAGGCRGVAGHVAESCAAKSGVPYTQPDVETLPGGNVVVNVPRQKVTLEASAESGGTAQAVTPTSQPAYPQAMMGGYLPAMTGGYPPAMMSLSPVGNFGAPAIASGQIRQRTGLAFELDTIKIPLPWIRLIPVQKPTEVTFQMPPGGAALASGVGYPPGMMASSMMGIPLAMPLTGAAGFGMPVVGAAGFGVPTGTVAAGASPMSLQQLAALQATMAAHAAGSGQTNGDVLRDDQFEELLRKCEELKKLKKERDDKLKKAAAQGKLDGQ